MYWYTACSSEKSSRRSARMLTRCPTTFSSSWPVQAKPRRVMCCSARAARQNLRRDGRHMFLRPRSS
eukprot:10880276-Lingulodinium_polyedra.AAC.1